MLTIYVDLETVSPMVLVSLVEVGKKVSKPWHKYIKFYSQGHEQWA